MTWAVHVQLLDTRRAAQARLRHKGKKDWQLHDFIIFLSLLLLHIIHAPFHIHHLAYCKYIHTFLLSFLCYWSSFKFINCWIVEVWGRSYALCVCLVIGMAVTDEWFHLIQVVGKNCYPWNQQILCCHLCGSKGIWFPKFLFHSMHSKLYHLRGSNEGLMWIDKQARIMNCDISVFLLIMLISDVCTPRLFAC